MLRCWRTRGGERRRGEKLPESWHRLIFRICYLGDLQNISILKTLFTSVIMVIVNGERR